MSNETADILDRAADALTIECPACVGGWLKGGWLKGGCSHCDTGQVTAEQAAAITAEHGELAGACKTCPTCIEWLKVHKDGDR